VIARVRLFKAQLRAATKERRQWQLARNRADRALAKLDLKISTLEKKIANLESVEQRTSSNG